MMNESVKKLLKASMWDLATCANGEPNVVPVAFKDVTSDGKLVVGDVICCRYGGRVDVLWCGRALNTLLI